MPFGVDFQMAPLPLGPESFISQRYKCNSQASDTFAYYEYQEAVAVRIVVTSDS